MFGHNLPDGIYNLVAERGQAYINNVEGKPVVGDALVSNTVAVVFKKPDNEVETITDAEREEMNRLQKPFVFVGSTKDISDAYLPDRYTENHPYLNRPFLHGVFDCYTLVRDYYRRMWGMWLPANIQRTYGWWEQGDNLYVDGAGNYGFKAVSQLRRHDVIIMKLGPVPNHGAVYLGNEQVMHHLGGRFSCIEKLTPFMRQSIAVVYRSTAVEEAVAAGNDREPVLE